MGNRASIYARFSCSKQREASIEDQLRVCREWCEREGYEVVAEYCDHAISGRTDARPEFQRMVANAGESDIILVYQMDRFSRDPYDAPIYKRELARHNVRVVSAMENVPDTPEGMLLDKLLEGMAAMESIKNSERTRRGMHGNALKCLANGVRVYGYTVGADGRYEVDDAQAALVRLAYSMRLEGHSANAIAQRLASMGAKTYTGRPCSASMVETMLRSEKYVGVYAFGDVRVEGGMPAIIDRDTWEAVQAAPRPKRRRAERWHDYRLAGKSLCVCGASMVGTSGHGNGGRYDYYRCGAKCGQVPNVRADWLERTIVDAVRTVLSDRSEALRIARIVKEHVDGGDAARRREAARQAVRDAEKELDNLMDAIAAGLAHPSMQQRIDAATERRERAQRDLLLMDSAQTVDVGDFADFLQFGTTLDDATVLAAFVGQVVVLPDRVAVTLNYADESKRPAYLEVGGFAEMDYGSPDGGLCEPYATVVNGVAVVVVPLAA